MIKAEVNVNREKYIVEFENYDELVMYIKELADEYGNAIITPNNEDDIIKIYV